LAEIIFADERPDAGEGARLLDAMREEIAGMYEGLDLDAPDMPKAGPAELGPPGGAFLLGTREGEAVCCGGIKDLGDGACEIKRMYVVPQARGQGVARALLHALEQRAKDMGYQLARLDTGPRQPHSRRLYESEGYRQIANFNANPVANFFGEKQLA
jgi:GNAT superfamily N-acetyltransferase